MSDEIDFLGKKYISSKRASEISGYTNDYIGQLCRENKIRARRVGRDWFVDYEYFINYCRKKGYLKIKKEEKEKTPFYLNKSALIFASFAMAVMLIAGIFWVQKISSFSNLTQGISSYGKIVSQGITNYALSIPQGIYQGTNEISGRLVDLGTNTNNLILGTTELAMDGGRIFSDFLTEGMHGYIFIVSNGLNDGLANFSSPNFSNLTQGISSYGKIVSQGITNYALSIPQGIYQGTNEISGRLVDLGTNTNNLILGTTELAMDGGRIFSDEVINGLNIVSDNSNYIFANALSSSIKANRQFFYAFGNVSIGAGDLMASFFDNAKKNVKEFKDAIVNGPKNVKEAIKDMFRSEEKIIVIKEISKKSTEADVEGLVKEISQTKKNGLAVEGQVVQKTIVEKTIERVVSGLSDEELDVKLQQLNNKLMAEIIGVKNLTALNTTRTSSNTQMITLTQRVDNLSGVTLNNTTFTGTVSGLSLTGDYLPLSGGTLTGALTGTDLTLSGFLSVTGTSTLSATTTLNGVSYTWPSADGTNGQALSTNGSGTLSWSSVSASGGAGTSWEINAGGLLAPTTTISVLANSNLFVTGDTDIYGGDINLGTGIATSTLTSTSGLLGMGTSTPIAFLSTESSLGGDIPLFVVASSTDGAATSTAFIIDAKGRVGIGMNPAYTLDIAGSLGITSNLSIASDQNLYIGNSFASGFQWDTGQINDSMLLAVPVGSASQGGSFILIEGADSSTNFAHQISTDPTFYIQSSDATQVNDYISFWHNQTDANIAWGNGNLNIGNMSATSTFTSTGQLGIGTTSPGALLSVAGTGAFDSWVSADYFLATSTTATSTFAGGFQTDTLDVQSTTATSTFGNGLRVETGGLSLDQLINCNTIDTDASGNLICGTDEGLTSSAFGQAWDITAGGLLAPTTTISVLANSNLFVTGDTDIYGGDINLGTGTATSTLTSASGNLGIGTTSPYATLSIVGDSVFDSNVINIASSSASSLTLNYLSSATSTIPTTGNWNIANNITDIPIFTIEGSTGSIGIGTSSPFARLTASSTNLVTAVFDQNGTNDIMQLWDAGTPMFVVQDGGNVGVGTTTPWARLTIEQLANDANVFVIGDEGTSTPAVRVDAAGITYVEQLQTGAMTFDTNAGVVSWMDMPVTSAIATGTPESYSANIDANPILTIYAESYGTEENIGIQNQAVGIGTTSPFASLSVSSATGTIPVAVFYNSSSTELFRIDSGSNSNNIGLGTTTPAAKLSLAGISVDTTPLFMMSTSTASATTTSLVIDSNGLLGIGSSTPFAELSVLGHFAIDGLASIGVTSNPLCLVGKDVMVGTGADCTASSQRFKYDIQDQLEALPTVMSLHPTSFKLKATDEPRLGLIAEEVYLVEPRLADLDKEGLPSSVRYAELTSVLTKAIQELNLKIENMGGSPRFAGEAGQPEAANESIFSSILNFLKDKIVQATEFIADKITAKKIVTESLEMKDSVTGETYCIKITNGEWEKVKGACETESVVAPEPAPEIIPESAPVEPQPEIPAEEADTIINNQ